MFTVKGLFRFPDIYLVWKQKAVKFLGIMITEEFLFFEIEKVIGEGSVNNATEKYKWVITSRRPFEIKRK